MPPDRTAPTDHVDLGAIRTGLRHAGWMARYFRYQVHGLSHVPRSGPALMVMNHGFLPVDALLLGAALHQSHRRLPRALMDRIFNYLPYLRETMLAFGAVEGRSDLAASLLGQGNLVIVFPGGAREAFKSTAQRYQLMWEDRSGFARLAIRTGVPVIPTVCIGIDDLYLVFNDGYSAGRKLLGIKSLPLPLALGLGPLPFPVRLTAYVGEPLAHGLPPQAAEDEDAVKAYRDQIQNATQALLTHGLAERRSLL